MHKLMTYIEYVEDVINKKSNYKWNFYEYVSDLDIFEEHLIKYYQGNEKAMEAMRRNGGINPNIYVKFLRAYVFLESDEDFFKSLFKENDINNFIKIFAFENRDKYCEMYANYCNKYAEKIREEDKIVDCIEFDEIEWENNE